VRLSFPLSDQVVRPVRISRRPGRPCRTNSVAIASNESFSGSTKTFTDPRLCAAIVDRLTFGGNIVKTGVTSYRHAHTRAQGANAASRAWDACSA